MLPPPDRARLAAPWRSAWKVPFRFSETTLSNSSSLVSASLLRTFTPGVETSPRGRKPSVSRPRKRLSTDSPERMSTPRETAVPPSVLIAAATASAADSSRSAITTLAPDRAASRALASPIPEAPPITTTSIPSSEKGEAAGFTARALSPGTIRAP